MTVFGEAFGLPPGHMLREVRSASQTRGKRAVGWRWEHEEYDAGGALVAVYESWTTQGADPLDADAANGIEGFIIEPAWVQLKGPHSPMRRRRLPWARRASRSPKPTQ